MDSKRRTFEQQLKQKLSQKCTAHQNEEQFLIKSFKFFDFKNAGEVDFPTFTKAIAKMGVAVDDSDIADFFAYYDTNGNGRLDYKEFSDIVFGRQAPPSRATPSTNSQWDRQSQASSRAGFQAQQQQAPMSYRGIRDPKIYLENIRDKIKARGARGIIGLARVFKIMDDNNSKSLDKAEFKKAINDFKLEVPDEHINVVFNAFDLNRDGTIDYDEFLRIIRGDLTPNRLKLVTQAFKKLDRDGSGVVDINDIRGVYNASKHPDVISGKKHEDQVLNEFLETFEAHHNIRNGNRADGQITLDEFVEYYTNISASIDLDEYFALMMNNSWNLTGDAQPYQKHKKAWADKSPERKNQYAGEVHTGYVQGKNEVKMVAQRMGMVSSENPLATTTRYYTNNFDSKRKVPSVANDQKNYGEGRNYYQRTGIESKNNPLVSHNTKTAYTGYHGKKVEEIVSEPLQRDPKFLQYHLQRITQQCTQRGERGLFGLKRLFQTFDFNGNGVLEFKEFERALKDFKLDLEEQDVQILFANFDENNDGTIQVEEFMNKILGSLNITRQTAVDQAFKKFEVRGNASYRALREAFDGRKHPEVSSGRKSPDEVLTDFLEIFEIHHNSFNNYQKTDQVSKQEFNEFYRTLSPNYEDDATFCAMVRGVWGVKNDVMSASYASGWAGGANDAQNSRDRYIKANFNKGTPFGTTQTESASAWNTTAKQMIRPVSAVDLQSQKIAGAPSRQQVYVQQYSSRASNVGNEEEIMEKFRDRMRQRGARGIIGLGRVFKIIDDDNSHSIDRNEFAKALKDYRVQITPDEANVLYGIFDTNRDGRISYDEFLRGVVGTMNQNRIALVRRAFEKLDTNRNGIVELEDIKNLYNAKFHPDVKLGKKTEEEVLIEFMDTFEMHYSLTHPGTKGDKMITFDEFVEYYNNVSMSIEDDRYFELMMTNAWNLNNAAPQKRGWGGQF